MKKLLFVIIATVALTACDPPEWLFGDFAQWYVKNTTTEPIKVLMPSHSKEELVVAPGDSITIFRGTLQPADREQSFDLFTEQPYWYHHREEKDKRIDILSESGELLKTWKWVEREQAGIQFFNEKFWNLYIETQPGGGEYKDIYWVFEITPENIEK